MAEHPWQKHYDPGVPHNIDYPAVPLFLRRVGTQVPRQTMYTLQGGNHYIRRDGCSDSPAGLFMVNIPQFLIAFYAILKAGGVVIAFNPLYGLRKEGSIGVSLPDVDARIILLDNEETVLGLGEIGELVIKGPQGMKGYHNIPTETANALREGWLYTGDIDQMDEDGYFYIVDRKKELIKPSGYQVWPREVEEVIAENPKVLEVGVAGIPDAYRGETVKAWVVLKDGETATVDEIRAWCKERIAPFKVPTQVEFRDELPKTTIGKILRRELQRQEKERQEQETG